uniref:Uncharacterized protein n=1 Tax=Rhizophagus irregularis (strain DAOM 181602 / DAOM 197198 / MUCL 43194) TaxID=747089 RepID=U9U8S4_RHIID
MKCIVFIIVFLNTFSNTFAWGFNYDCTGRQWINGYSENNSVDPNDCVYRSQTDCDKVYQGAIEYKRADYFDPSMFPSPGESVIIAMDSPYHSQVITAAAPKISGIQENEMINTPKSNVTVCTENLKPIELTKSSPSKFRVHLSYIVFSCYIISTT